MRTLKEYHVQLCLRERKTAIESRRLHAHVAPAACGAFHRTCAQLR